MVLMLGDEKGYDRLGEAGNWDIYSFLKRISDEDEKKQRELLEEEDPEMYYEFLEWVEEYIDEE